MNYDDYKLSNPYDNEDVFGNPIDSEEELEGEELEEEFRAEEEAADLKEEK